MRQLVNTRHGPPEVLQIREVPTPVPQDDELLIRVSRAGINYADLSARMGLYQDAPKPPMVMGYEVAGTVEAAGPGSPFRPGTRVLAFCHFGGQATHVLVKPTLVRELPPEMTFDQGAALPVNYLTAFHMLFRVAHLRSGMSVLVHSAGGGVGMAVADLARSVPGVRLFGTASASKHEALRAAGFSHLIDYRTEDYAKEVVRIAGERCMDIVLDPLGGPDWRKGYQLLRPAGHLVMFGWSNMTEGGSRSVLRIGSQFLQMPRFSPIDLLQNNRSVSGVNMGHFWDHPEILSDELKELFAFFAAGKLSPRVDKVFPLAEAAEAHRFIGARKNVGKVLLDCT